MDSVFAWTLVLLGSAHFLSAYVPRLGALRGPWAEGVAVAIVAVGLMNAVRSQREGDLFLRWTTAVATAMTAGLCLRVLYHTAGNVLHRPAALATGALAVLELVFGVAGA
jgi:hypothetical protein